MSSTTVHIINHTHWDRDWFLTSIYTSQWLPDLIDRLKNLTDLNPKYQFLLDGQTLVVEDLLKISPEYGEIIKELVEEGNLIIGPYYCQPDWLMTDGEAVVRNLLYGHQDMKTYGAENHTGWLVDTFGHISQAPQLHRLSGIDSVYIWRGVPRMEPYFLWQSPESSTLFTVNLFGGYRNLYGVTSTPDLAVQRLQTEVNKLHPYYPTPDIPLFDGYDLEDDPEDPLQFFQQSDDIPENLVLRETTPQEFAKTIADKLTILPTIHGELNSGKYGATFPGTLSARTYLKIMAYDCEHLLYQVCEPLAVLARLRGRSYPAGQYEDWARNLLRNAVHDCLCGVSIDQVHEKMEFTYHQVFEGLQTDLAQSLAHILQDFSPGTYAASTNPFPSEGWQIVQGRQIHTKTGGVGIWPVEVVLPAEIPDALVQTFTWQNDHYKAAVLEDGMVQVGAATLGKIVVSAEKGDTYSDELGDVIGVCRPIDGIVIEQRSDRHCVLRILYAVSWGDIQISATVRLIFDPSPMIRWQIELDSQGTDFRMDVIFETARPSQVYTGMPFDIIPRRTADTDLLPRKLDDELASVLLGQRELGCVRSFPFHDFIAISDGSSTSVVFARGVHAYQADENGRIALTLRRAVEWLTRADLEHRIGDAGPFFYVPDARCERTVLHELAFVVGEFSADDPELQRLNASFQNPPIIVETFGSGKQTEWKFLQENLPLSSLHISTEKILARFYNPTQDVHTLNHLYTETDIWGHPEKAVQSIPPKKIVTVDLDHPLPPVSEREYPNINVLTPLSWRVGKNQGLPDPTIIAQLREQAARLHSELMLIEEELEGARGNERYIIQHNYYVLRREMYEYLLSARLNEIKLAMNGDITYEYLFIPDDEIAEIGLQLNQMRIKRRIYDYVIRISNKV
ncbi:MAG: hypothetical protein U9R58_07720 [Chloroflexota bacterium]|nr:hypothetical protein [Chloroflexota bacterium]